MAPSVHRGVYSVHLAMNAADSIFLMIHFINLIVAFDSECLRIGSAFINIVNAEELFVKR